MERSLEQWEELFEKKVAELNSGGDPAHDLAHFKRVVKTARALALEEGAELEVVIPAAWLHDYVNVPKDDPRRPQASRMSAEAARSFLSEICYPECHLEWIVHAIEAHSFSAGIVARTIEAQVVQDADRLDGLGAIGVARCFTVAGCLGQRLYDPDDPMAERRALDDSRNTVDHFFVKLFKSAESLQTRAGRAEGIRRLEFMKAYLGELRLEIS